MTIVWKIANAVAAAIMLRAGETAARNDHAYADVAHRCRHGHGCAVFTPGPQCVVAGYSRRAGQGRQAGATRHGPDASAMCCPRAGPAPLRVTASGRLTRRCDRVTVLTASGRAHPPDACRTRGDSFLPPRATL